MNQHSDLSRRRFLAGSGAVLVGGLIAGPLWAEKAAGRQPSLAQPPSIASRGG